MTELKTTSSEELTPRINLDLHSNLHPGLAPGRLRPIHDKCHSLPNSARSDIAARGAGLAAVPSGCSSRDGEPGPSHFT